MAKKEKEFLKQKEVLQQSQLGNNIMFKKVKNLYNEAGIRAYTGMKMAQAYAVEFEHSARNHVKTDNKAQGILEYGLIIALVSIAVIGAVLMLKNTIVEKLNGAANQISNANGN